MLAGKSVVLGITGSIAAYKAAEIASRLVQQGVEVRVVMTESATRFITPLSLRAITGRPVVTSMWRLESEFSIEHVSLAEEADVVLIAPATANIIAHMAAGLADDMLSCTILATEAPVVLAPAMNVNMYENPATQENIARLKKRGFIFVGPQHGRLASGRMGVGRLADVDEILGVVKTTLGERGDLAGKTIIVTAGGTREPLDPVRYIGNRSSGKMGLALAQAARDRGASVKLITTMPPREDTVGMEVTEAATAIEMKEAVVGAVKEADALFMAAAVADFMPEKPASRKTKKDDGLDIKLIKTPDILSEIRGDFAKVGFAAESENLVENATAKLKAKKLDLIVANDITDENSGFGSDTNKVTIIDEEGKVEQLPLLSKRDVAEQILDRVVGLFKKG
jgi:phosphopantothenoylcysteine decarboxylase/phosphopantothenate--cysteine ligase